MATASDATRRGERGLSLIEALVIVTVTALLALILLPLASRSAGRNFAVAERALDAADAARAETQVRALARASGAGAAWEPGAVVLEPSLDVDVACARAGGPARVRLRIDAAGALWCESESGRVALLRWRDAAAGFSYSADGRRWSRRWVGEGRPGYLRFQLEGRGGDLAWTAELSAPEPENAEAAP